jgi:hypothetical protein
LYKSGSDCFLLYFFFSIQIYKTKKMKHINRLFGLCIVIILSYWLVRPLLSHGYFPMHDDTQVARVVVMGRALGQGQFPVRWVSDLGYGYGYPIYNFYGPLPYYVGGGLYAGGVDSVIATKIMFGIGVLLASITFYFLLEDVFGTLAAITGTILFTYAPYHALDIYIRGAVGEYWAIAFLPLLLLGIVWIFEKKRGVPGVVAGAIGIAGIILSHTIVGYLTTGMTVIGIIFYSFISIIQQKFNDTILLKLLGIVLFGLGMSAFFWLPAFAEMNVTGVSAMVKSASTGFFDHFVCPVQLWNSPWGYGGSAPGCVDGMSFKLGKPEIFMALVGVVIWVFSLFQEKRTKVLTFVGGGIVLLIVSLSGLLDISKSIWSIIPYYSFIQYPWRLLSYTIVALGIIGASIITVIHGRVIRILLAVCVITLCIGINAKLFQPQYLYTRDSKEFETAQELRFRISKISDEYLPSVIPKPVTFTAIPNMLVKGDTITLHSIKETDTNLIVEVMSAKMQRIQIQRAYFPGWQYFVNGLLVPPTIDHGLPSVVVSEGKSIVEARFTNTPVRLLGNIISFISIVLFGGVLFYDIKTNP